MARVALTQGAYQARSVIAAAQRCVNLIPEKNPQGEDAPYTHYSAPGLTFLGRPPNGGAARGLYWANSNLLFCAAGATLYTVSSTWVFTSIGTIDAGTTPVSMADNGTTLVLVDGTANGYQVTLSTLAFSAISSANNSPPPDTADPSDSPVYAFYGADRVDVLDGFLIFNYPATQSFYCTYNNEVVFDATYFAEKNGFSDQLVAVIVSRREIWLIGQRTTEIWYDAGGATFPFQIMPGPFIQHGCSAKYSVAQINGAIFWLSQDQAGGYLVARGYGFDAKRVSTHALETAISSYSVTADAIGFCYQQQGHSYYVLTFPTADATWCYDESTELWHERVTIDTNGVEHRHVANCAAFAYGVNVVGSFVDGALYALDLANQSDTIGPMVYRRGFPHMMDDGKRVRYARFVLDIQAAQSTGTTTGTPPLPLLEPPGQAVPQILWGDLSPSTEPLLAPGKPNTAPTVSLRWSDTRGASWGDPVQQTLGATGQNLTQVQWRRLGMARDRVFEVFGTMSGQVALNGAFVDTETAES